MNVLTDAWYKSNRIAGLRRFAIAITGLNIMGHFVLGFEQSWMQPLVALAVGYAAELLFESVDSWAHKRSPKYLGGPVKFIDFMLPAHISATTVSLLLYANDQLWPMAFAVAVTVGSKTLFRLAWGNGPSRHFLNPSNLGISATLLLFPWVGISPPYHFTENVSGVLDWILPIAIITLGTFLNTRYTQRLPLIGVWLGVFVLQALVRSAIFDMPFVAGLIPMTGMAFLLYTFYMITDPGTSPSSARNQMIFGAAVAVTYGILVSVHIVFGLFFALTIVTAIRGVGNYLITRVADRTGTELRVKPVVVREV